MTDSIPQKKIIVVPLDDDELWQIQLINGEDITVLNIHEAKAPTEAAIRNILQHYIDIKSVITPKIQEFLIVENIEFDSDSKRFMHSFGYVQ